MRACAPSCCSRRRSRCRPWLNCPIGVPARFIWRRASRRVVKAEGPERLGAEWWALDARPQRTRDYYRVEDENGRRYWLYREGLYGREDADRAPSWWIAGVFA